ncbi:MAG TPA: hypothetical protein DCE56_18640 [Cyanobacteria bacterium UBA8553]|nr:hypothetical protein [Cyanobacteria bacterium UBA8553]
MEVDIRNRESKHKCDLVMKGGITSGIVYPPIVLKLAETYQFCNIGGTSAGAIAAAVTAAAEYGRDVPEAKGFEGLDQLRKELSEDGFLQNLFQPSEETKPLMETLLSFITDKKKENKSQKKSIVGRFFQFTEFLEEKHPTKFKKGSLRGYIIGLILALALTSSTSVIFALTGSSVSNLSFIVLLFILGLSLSFIGGLLGGTGVSLYDLYHILTVAVPKNLFGMCTGRTATSSGEKKPVLTDWLSTKIDQLSGISGEARTLTFTDLKKKEINLKMVASNLSHNQPYSLPFSNESLFVFKEDHFKKLFPDNIVKYLTKPETQAACQHESYKLPDGYYFLPKGDALPVVVAMRISLSFPLLLSAVPLYTISQSASNRAKEGGIIQLSESEETGDLQINWFSDGGISSNFPIQFFDSWLPKHPTFGINLTSLPPEALEEKSKNKVQVKPKHISAINHAVNLTDTATIDQLSKEVYLPGVNDPFLGPEWIPIQENLLKFLNAIWSTAQNYRDNMQSNMRSYRERVVEIRLSDDEGGLNLAMSPKTIENVVGKGVKAGEKIIDYFNFDQHQCIRFQVLMGLLETELKKMKEVLQDSKDDPPKVSDYKKLLREQNYKTIFPAEEYWTERALTRIELILNLMEWWGDKPYFAPDPLPSESVLRVTPEL